MSPSQTNQTDDRPRERVVGLLAGYLLGSSRFRCPGMDGSTIEDVVAVEYPVACRAGWVPGPELLVADHPDLAEALASYFLA